jgi:hypothetical protein
MRMSVIEWLRDSDPSIRWQVMRDLIGEPDANVARERLRVAAEGWGARLLDLQGADGHWGGAAFVPPAWISTKDTLQLLRDLGVDPTSDRVRRAIGQVRNRCTWGEEFGNSPFFEGEVEPCNGDGSQARHHRRSPSRTGVPSRAAPVPIAINRTDHHTGVDRDFVSHALALRPPVGPGLPAVAGVAPDERMAEAIDLVRKKRDELGRWPLENPHPGPVHFEMEGRAGEPSRWNTLRALRVLRWASAS